MGLRTYIWDGTSWVEQTSGTDNVVTSITGTSNQVTASAPNGAVTLSLPQSIATTSTPQFASIELGNASDTTLSRSAAGTLAVENVDVVTTSAAQTLTNKTSYNKVAITAPATSATLTLADGSTLATSGAYSTTLTATGTTTLTLPTSGTVATTSNNLGAFAASTSAAIGVGSIELGAASDTTIARASAGVISVEGVTVPRMYNAALTGTGTSFTVSHGLGAIWPTVTVYDITTGKYIIPDHKVDLTSGAPSNPGTVTITFPASVTGSNYRVVITG